MGAPHPVIKPSPGGKGEDALRRHSRGRGNSRGRGLWMFKLLDKLLSYSNVL